LTSLLAAVGPPTVLGLLVSGAAVALQGKASHLPEFILTASSFIVSTMTGTAACALVVGSATWPTVDGMASRRPPEARFRAVSEVLKVASLGLVTMMLPVMGTSIAQATNLSTENAKWQVLKDRVALRFSVQSDEEFSSYKSAIRDLAASASEAGKLTLSYAFSPRSRDRPGQEVQPGGAEFDGIVLANPDYLRAISPLVVHEAAGSQQVLERVAEPVAYDELPEAAREFWSNQFPLLNRARNSLEGLKENLRYYRYTGNGDFPALPPVPGEMVQLQHPLIIVVDRPADAFNDFTIAAFLSSGNLTFSDSAWLKRSLDASPLATAVLSVDRLADAALYNSQLQNQSAGLKTLSFALVLLALTMGVAVSAMVYAISRAKRLFVQRTAGWSWLRALARRIAWEAMIATALATAMFFALGGASKPEVFWTLAGIPLYLTVAVALHLVSARNVFAKTLARRA
ncbi:hypothetical protein, partial [Sinomonas sp.]|uniref:hypothetical protein n=1 Tax=Sinomonas sp. TaxID=1914986 RepID=UPI002FE22388